VKHRDAFNLLGEGKRFYQDATFRSECSRTVGDLRTDLPTGTTIAHFRHLRDLAYGLCPACCAGGLIRFCAFATAYGGGSYTSAVNGQSPAFALAEGRTLLRTIVLNALESAPSGRPPPWLIDEGPGEEDDLEAVTVLAWRSRRVWLGEAADWGSSCACCGDQGPTVREMAFTGGWKLPFAKSTQKKFWKDDPHLVLAPTAHSKGDPAAQADGLPPGSEAAKEVTTLGFPAPALGVAVRARFWRRALTQLARGGRQGGPCSAVRVRLAGPAANKALYQDATAISLPPVPPDTEAHAKAALQRLDETATRMRPLLRASTPNPDQQHLNRMAALDARSASMESALRARFEEWLGSPESAHGPPPAEDVARPLRSAVEAVVGSTTPGSPLRRQEALRRARRALDAELAKLAKATGNAEEAQHDSD
jgi:hypothetical protein